MSTSERVSPASKNYYFLGGLPEGNTLRDLPEFRLRLSTIKDRIFHHVNSALSELPGYVPIRYFHQFRHLVRNTEVLDESTKRKIVQSYLEELGYGKNANEQLITQSFQNANAMDRYFFDQNTGLFSGYDSHTIAPRNEISHENDVFELLAFATDPHADKRLRFEALRKLVYMEADLRLSQRSAESDRRMADMAKLLQEHFWIGTTGETFPLPLVTFHDDAEYKCVGWKHEGDSLSESTPDGAAFFREKTLQVRKWVDDNGVEHSTLYEDRTKDPVSKLLKAIRKDTINPDDIKDELGFKFVFENRGELRLFLKEFADRLRTKGGKRIMIEDLVYSLDCSFNGNSRASNRNFQVVKFDVIMDEITYEFQFFTIEGYMDSEYRDGLAVREYQVSRLFDGGVVGHLIPRSVYDYDQIQLTDWREKLVRENRQHVRNTSSGGILSEVI